MRWATVASGPRKARAIASVVSPQALRRASAARASPMRQTARIVRLISAAVMTAERVYATLGSCAGARVDLAHAVPVRHRIGANLTGSFPARHVFLVELHELDCQRHRLFLVPQL